MGFNGGIGKFIIWLNGNAIRHFKLHGRYGEPVSQTTGLGQGDPFSVLVALVYVGAQLLAVQA